MPDPPLKDFYYISFAMAAPNYTMYYDLASLMQDLKWRAMVICGDERVDEISACVYVISAEDEWFARNMARTSGPGRQVKIVKCRAGVYISEVETCPTL